MCVCVSVCLCWFKSQLDLHLPLLSKYRRPPSNTHTRMHTCLPLETQQASILLGCGEGGMEHGIYIAVFYIFSFIELMRFLLEKTQVLKMFVLDLCLLYFMINKKKRKKSNNKNNNYYKKLDNRKTWVLFFCGAGENWASDCWGGT